METMDTFICIRPPQPSNFLYILWRTCQRRGYLPCLPSLSYLKPVCIQDASSLFQVLQTEAAPVCHTRPTCNLTRCDTDGALHRHGAMANAHASQHGRHAQPRLGCHALRFHHATSSRNPIGCVCIRRGPQKFLQTLPLPARQALSLHVQILAAF